MKHWKRKEILKKLYKIKNKITAEFIYSLQNCTEK